ncbi:MAG TPA: DUF6350 family protein [Pseudonocardiaceae bacterium]|nr:DUF6350 family protein [Pseudonocardiaceae bacterium]
MPAHQSVAHGVADQVRPAVDDRRRVLVLAAVGPILTGYVGIAALLALITATAPGTAMSLPGVLATTGPAWLAGYHVPVAIAGHELGVLPLLPTAVLLLLVARVAGNAARRLDLAGPRAAVTVIGPIAAAHAIVAMAFALLSNGTASPLLAFVITGVLAAAAATLGVAGPCALLPAALRRADDATVAGLRAGVLAVSGLAAVGAVVFAVGLIASWSTTAQLFRLSAPGFGSGLGMFLLSVAYLPNALIATLSFAAGPGFGMGAVSVAQWHFHAGPLPAVPLLAPLPAVEGHWWVFLMLLPAVVGVLTGVTCRQLTDLATRCRAVLLAALVAGVSCLILAAMAGGPLAGGPFGPVTVPAGSLAVSAFLAIAIPGVLTVWLAGRTPALLGMDDDYEDEYFEEEEDDTTETEPDEPADPE